MTFLETFLATFLPTLFSAGSSCTLWVTVKLKFVHVLETGKASKKPIIMILLIFSVSFIQSFSDALIFYQWYCHFLWILLRQPIQWNISVDCSRLVQPRFLRILLSCLRLSRIPWTLRRKLRISEAVNLSEAIGYVAFIAWLCYVTTSEPVRKELLSQRVFVCIKNATKNDKVSFIFAVFRGFFS